MRFAITLFATLVCLVAHAAEHQVALQDAEFELVRDEFWTGTMDFHGLPEEKAFHVTYWGSHPSVVIQQKGRVLFTNAHHEPSERVVLTLGDESKTLLFWMQTKPATYSDEYISERQRSILVETPEVYELASILLALSDHYHQTKQGMFTGDSYFERLVNWFAPYKDHEIFQRLNGADYYAFVENAAAYYFDGSEIVESAVYHGFRLPDDLAEHRDLLENFAKISRFRDFYANERSFYLAQADEFRVKVQPERVQQWLERHFPARYSGYRVLFSPLGPGNNSARMYADNGFQEAVLFIVGPNRYSRAQDSETIQSLKMLRSFFTEVDHAYVNPLSKQFLNEINEAMKDLRPWYKGGGYDNPYLTFNEYMTWSLVSLYVQEHYTPAESEYFTRYITAFMEERRGFFRFREFNSEMIRLYGNREPGEVISDLYPKILAWVENHSGEEENKSSIQ